MRKRKLIAIDLDGTLLDSSLSVSPFSVSIIKKLKEQGHVIVLASGRPYRSIKDIYYSLELDSPLIAYNGALVFNPKDSSFPKLERKFSSSSLRKIYGDNKDILLSGMAEDEKTIYLQNEDLYLNNYFPYLGENHLIGELEEIILTDCYTALFNCLDIDVDRLKKSVNEEGLLFRHWNGNTYSEAALKDVNKGTALEYILKELNISPEECIAFGDSDNDYEMLSIAGNAYVLSNSKSAILKDSFKITEKGNDEDGVALTLRKIFSLF